MDRSLTQCLPAIFLSSSIIGLILTPLCYIIIGALTQFESDLCYWFLPAYSLGTLYLLFLYLDGRSSSLKSIEILFEIISWVVILCFLYIISNYTLFSWYERVGLFSTFWLVLTVSLIPITVIKKTSIEKRLMRLGYHVARLLLFFLGIMTSGFAGIFMMNNPGFI